MDAPARLLLIRPAHTDPGSRLCGSFHLPLSHTGRAQVQALLEHPGICARPDALYTDLWTRNSAQADDNFTWPAGGTHR
jgi:broad specificity phosphatase PhoE